MKKVILSICFMFLFNTAAMASCDYSQFCASQPYDLTSNGNQFFSKVTGMTFLSEEVAQAIIKKQLKKSTGENFKVEIKTYSPIDLLNGRFKSLKISGKNLNVDGAYISSLEAKTACDFNYIELNKNKSIKFKENMVMDFAVQMSNLDLKKTVNSAGYLEMMNRVNLSAYGITFFKLNGADVDIKNNKVYFTIKVTTPFSSKPVSVVVKSDLKVEDGRIVLTKVELPNLFSVLDLSKATYILNAINPLTFTTSVLGNSKTKIQITAVDIVGCKILVKGIVLIPKNTVTK